MKKYRDYWILIIFTMGSQAIIYFLLKTFTGNFNIINSFLDIPLKKFFVYFYNIWYPFMVIVTFIIYKFNKQIFRYAIASLLLATFFGHITFLLYPTMIIRPEIDIVSFTDLLLYTTYKLDSPAVNCLPSMHCTYCFVAIYYIFKVKGLDLKYKAIVIALLIIIVLSTLFTGQHVIEDVILALLYSSLAIFIVYLTRNIVDKIFRMLKLTK